MTRPQVKNAIHRYLKSVIDPNPRRLEIIELWNHFNSMCCYCGRELDMGEREGHIDHLIPESAGGKNFKYNRVLSCRECNGDMKRDRNWEEFLKESCKGDKEAIDCRRKKISDWTGNRCLTVSEAEKRIIEENFSTIVNILDEKIAVLKNQTLGPM